MNNNGNGHCPRCIGGTLIKEGKDILCLNCGYRTFNGSKRQAAKDYLSEAICARLILDDSNEIDDLLDRDFKLAGMAAK